MMMQKETERSGDTIVVAETLLEDLQTRYYFPQLRGIRISRVSASGGKEFYCRTTQQERRTSDVSGVESTINEYLESASKKGNRP
jgi:hypothetical protein